ncbi:MAG: hypothetical protein KDK01_10025 [Rhodobacteraceae bacterium]|jgi:hypothetical protein|nr:hypothetical protein [Paracoccaceae bacterium]
MQPWIPRSIPAAIVLVVAFGLPAQAQDSAAKEAWTDLRTAARDHGVLIASQGVTDYGSSLVAQNLRIYLEEDPEGMIISMPEMRIEPRGTALALIPSPEFSVTLHPDRRSEVVIVINHEGEIVADVTEDRIALDLLFGQLGATLARAVDSGRPLDMGFDLAMTGFSAQMVATREGSADFSLGADQSRYSFHFNDDSGHTPMQQSGDAEIAGLRIELSGRELDMLSDEPDMLRQAFEAGFSAHLLFSVDSGTGTSAQIADGQPISIDSSYGANELTVDISDGQFAARTSARDGQISGEMAPFAGALGFDLIGLSLGFPMIASQDDQAMHFALNLENVVASDETLQLFGAQDFAGDSITAALEVSALARLTEDMGPVFGQGDAPPFEVTSVSLDRLLARVGDAEFTGSGGFALLGGLMASLSSDIPNGTGDFSFDLVGGNALMNRLADLGVIPPDQQFFARMMMNGLGRAIGEDHLRSEVAIRPGGQITVNGAPLPF